MPVDGKACANPTEETSHESETTSDSIALDLRHQALRNMRDHLKSWAKTELMHRGVHVL